MHITVIAGPRKSGKTTVATALFLLFSGRGKSVNLSFHDTAQAIAALKDAESNGFEYVVAELAGDAINLVPVEEAGFQLAQIVFTAIPKPGEHVEIVSAPGAFQGVPVTQIAIRTTPVEEEADVDEDELPEPPREVLPPSENAHGGQPPVPEDVRPPGARPFDEEELTSEENAQGRVGSVGEPGEPGPVGESGPEEPSGAPGSVGDQDPGLAGEVKEESKGTEGR